MGVNPFGTHNLRNQINKNWNLQLIKQQVFIKVFLLLKKSIAKKALPN